MVDFYSLGALLYEMLTGLPPFYSNNRDEMYHNIVHKELSYPRYLSNEVVKLLRGLLCKDPERRLGSREGFAEIKRSEFCAGIDWDQMLKKKVKNMPPAKMNPSANTENLKSEFFDAEYTKSEPRLSIVAEELAANYLNTNYHITPSKEGTNSHVLLKRSKSQNFKVTFKPLELMHPRTDQAIQDPPQVDEQSSKSKNPFSSSNSRQTGSAQRYPELQTTRARAIAHALNADPTNRPSAAVRHLETQSPTFKNFHYSIFKKRKDQIGFSNFRKQFKKASPATAAEAEELALMRREHKMKNDLHQQNSIRKGNKQVVAQVIASKYQHQEEQPLRNNTDDSFSGSETRRQDHRNTEKCPIFIYRSANMDLQQEEKKIDQKSSNQSEEFERDSEEHEIKLYSKAASSEEDLKLIDDEVNLDTNQSQKHQNPIIERLKHSQEINIAEDHSEIVLDLRDESAALSNTFIANNGAAVGPLILSDPQSPQNILQKSLQQYQKNKVSKHDIQIPPLMDEFEGQSSSHTNILNIVINPLKEAQHNSAGRTVHSLTPKRENSEKLINTQIQNLFDHFMFKTKQEKGPVTNAKLFSRKQAIGETESRIQSSPVNTFLGIQHSYNNQLMVLGDQDSKVISPQGASPRSNQHLRKANSPPNTAVLEQAILQGSIFRQQNMLLKRRYGEVVGNVVQERQRRNPSRGNSSVSSFIKATTVVSQKKSGINLAQTTRWVINQPVDQNEPRYHGQRVDQCKLREHQSPNQANQKNSAIKKSPQVTLTKQTSKGSLKNPKHFQAKQKRDAKVYDEYFMQINKEQNGQSNQPSGSSTDRSPISIEKKVKSDKQTIAPIAHSLTIFSPTQMRQDSILETNPYLYQQKMHSRKHINNARLSSKSRSKSNEKLGFFRSFDAKTERGGVFKLDDRMSLNSKGSILQRYTQKALCGVEQKPMVTPIKNSNVRLFKNIDDHNYQGYHTKSKQGAKQLEPASLLKHTSQLKDNSGSNFSLIQGNNNLGEDVKINFVLYTARSHHNQEPIIHQIPLNLRPGGDPSSYAVQNTEPVPYNKGGPNNNFASPYLMGMQLSSQHNGLKHFVNDPTGASPHHTLPPFREEFEEMKIDSQKDDQESQNSIKSQVKPNFGGGSNKQPKKLDDPIALKKLIEDRKKEIREKIMQPTRILNTYVKPIKPQKAQAVKMKNLLADAGSPIRNLKVGGIPKSMKQGPIIGNEERGTNLLNNSILGNHGYDAQSKRQSEVGLPQSTTKSPMTLSISLKGPKNESSLKGSFLSFQQTGQYNILNEVLMSQKQPGKFDSHHHRVITQPQLNVTVSKPGAPSRFGGLKQNLGGSFKQNNSANIGSQKDGGISAIKNTPNRLSGITRGSTQQSNRPTPLHKKV